MLEKLWNKTESYAVAYDHPGCHRTSNAMDRPMNRLWRLVTEPAAPLPPPGSAMPAQVSPALDTIRRLIHKTIEAVTDDLDKFRFNRAVARIRELTNALEDMPSTEPGVYRFKTELSMQGRWQLSLGAKLQGENGSVENKLVVTAVP